MTNDVVKQPVTGLEQFLQYNQSIQYWA